MKISNFIILFFIVITACQTKKNSTEQSQGNDYTPQIIPLKINTSASFRGLNAVNDQIVWASGTQGTVIKTIDGGKNWQVFQVPQADTLDFRDIEAIDSNTAYILSAGQPARLYKTQDGGANWELLYENSHPSAFFDGLAFWDEKKGFAMSDPVEGEFLIIKTEDGQNWKEIAGNKIPDALEGEGGYAASGTNVAVSSGGTAWFVTGGPKARIFHSNDWAESWNVYITPVHSELPYSGIYSVAFKDKDFGIAVGGTFAHPDTAVNNAAITTDGGKTWQLLSEKGPGGYRSCVAHLPFTDQGWITVSRAGGDISLDNGKSWKKFTDEAYYSFSIAPQGKTGWASGAKGKIAKITFGTPTNISR
jgi:photosystem II stability/assembly factor-like uncharacterized protein